MGFRVGLWLLMAMVTVSLVLCSAARNANPFSEERTTEGRSLLRVTVHDYEDVSANRGHDPPSTRRRSLLGLRVDDYKDPSANRSHDPPSTKKSTPSARSGCRG
ncbi:hypothetical protein CRG98_007371 [Punica granatum]|uniref:Uncharacterized protein n=1 Tax=Punica granatum TaxID=22663 RepID=A0A2I0KUU4_PUNGR|nr:hypothetical protein CRG98_007371 [Punica granatum]